MFNNSYSRSDHREQILDLTIALENMYCQDTIRQTSENTYRLRIRASRYLGKTYSERKELSIFLGNLYDLRSKIVHGDISGVGKLLEKRVKMTLTEVVDYVQPLVRISLRRMLDNSEHFGEDYQNRLLLGG